MDDDEVDAAVRRAAFNLLSRLSWQYGDSLPRRVLMNGFDFDGNRVPLCGPQGIFKPKILALPLSITTAPNQPYNDTLTSDGRLAYKYRGQDPQHRDNVGLRQIMVEKKPLIYLHGLEPGKYLAAWPVLVVKDNPQTLTFTVDLDTVALDWVASGPTPTYGLATIQTRLHQGHFRAQVLKAYRKDARCVSCSTYPCLMRRTSFLIVWVVNHARPMVFPSASCIMPHLIRTSLASARIISSRFAWTFWKRQTGPC